MHDDPKYEPNNIKKNRFQESIKTNEQILKPESNQRKKVHQTKTALSTTQKGGYRNSRNQYRIATCQEKGTSIKNIRCASNF